MRWKNLILMLAAIPALCPLQSCDATKEEALLNDLTEKQLIDARSRVTLVDDGKQTAGTLLRFRKSFLLRLLRPGQGRPVRCILRYIHPILYTIRHRRPERAALPASRRMVRHSRTQQYHPHAGNGRRGDRKIHQGPGRIRYRHVPGRVSRQTPGNLSGKLTEPKK